MEVNFQDIFQFGDQILLNKDVNSKQLLKDLEQFDDKWFHYNEFKKYINRQGLCVLNESGENKPGPAISSLGEWNRANGTNFVETDFNIDTPVYHCNEELKELMDEIRPWAYRTHFLRLPPGGYFPPHRDSRHIRPDTFRLIMPLQNTANPWFRFMIEERCLHWSEGSLYAVNTTKEHMLFNAGTKDSIWLVINVKVCEDMFRYVSKNLAIQ